MHILQLDDIDFSQYEDDTEAERKIRLASEFTNDVLYELMPAEDVNRPKFSRLPFANCFVDFQPGETTLWAGYNNSGKSVLQGQMAALFAQQGQRCCVASFEMKPKKSLARIVRQMVGNSCPTRNQVDEYLQRLSSMWLYDQHGSITPKRMYSVARYCADTLKIQHLFIDSLMKCVPGTDNYNAQKDFLDTIFQIGLDTGMHMHLVVHLRKGEDEDSKIPNRFAIHGGVEISNIPDNILILWRNKRKEKDRDMGKEIDPSHPDAVLVCDKQRNGDWEGRVKLYYDRNSMKYTDHINIPRGLAATLRESKTYQGIKG